VVLRMMLGNLGVTVLPDTRSISSADKAFQADGSLSSSKDQKAVTRLGRILAETLERLGRSNDREDR